MRVPCETPAWRTVRDVAAQGVAEGRFAHVRIAKDGYGWYVEVMWS